MPQNMIDIIFIKPLSELYNPLDVSILILEENTPITEMFYRWMNVIAQNKVIVLSDRWFSVILWTGQ